MRRSLLILLAFILIPAMLLCSCKKKQHELVMQGRVYDPNTNAYVEGATVVLSASGIESGIFNSNYAEVATATTDASGNFTFNFTEDKVAGYRINVSKNRYFGYTEDINSDEIVSGTPYTPVYNIYPEGFVKLEVENFIAFDSSDHIIYSFSSGYAGCEGCCDNTLLHGYGSDFHDTLICMTHGNQQIGVTWSVTKNNLTTLHNGTFYCNAFDTVYYKINY